MACHLHGRASWRVPVSERCCAAAPAAPAGGTKSPHLQRVPQQGSHSRQLGGKACTSKLALLACIHLVKGQGTCARHNPW